MEVLKPSRSSNIGVFEFWNIVLVRKKKSVGSNWVFDRVAGLFWVLNFSIFLNLTRFQSRVNPRAEPGKKKKPKSLYLVEKMHKVGIRAHLLSSQIYL
jgi:hypothetical protein